MSKKDASSDSGQGKDVEAADAERPDEANAADRPDGEATADVPLLPEAGAEVEADEALKAAREVSEEQQDADTEQADEAPETGEGSENSSEDAEKPGSDDASPAEHGDAEVAKDVDTAKAGPDDKKIAPPPAARQPKPRRSWFGFFNFLLILALGAAGGYYWWLEQQAAAERQAILDEIRAEIESRAGASELARLDSGLGSLRGEIGSLGDRLGSLETEQQGLRQSTETLYELFGRDRADWQLAEVEYLMRVAQHKLILEDDFAGAALTLQAASDRLGRTGDPGMLPVRVTISEEVAALKTRERPDLVGMTLTLARLSRQVRSLQPGFAPRIDETGDGLPQVTPPEDWRDRVTAFIDSLVEVRHESAPPTAFEAEVVDVSETLEDNLKLARWAVLDRDAAQYSELIDRSLRLLREYYDLDNAANHEFLSELQALQKMQLRPQKPDITGSLRQMQEILSQRENAPEPAANTSETTDG